MKRLSDAMTVVGCAALAASLALLSTGVRAVRADDTPPGEDRVCSADEASCDASATGDEQGITEQQRRLREVEIAREKLRAAVAAGETVVLDGRGYNYRTEDGPIPGRVAPSGAR